MRKRQSGVRSEATRQPRLLSVAIFRLGVCCVRVGEGSVCDGRSKPKNKNRIVAQCFLDDLDVATLMIRAGMACDGRSSQLVTVEHVGVADVCIRAE